MTTGLLLLTVLSGIAVLAGLVFRRRGAAKRLDMGAVSPHWLAHTDREHHN
jgi:hypothetical protein